MSVSVSLPQLGESVTEGTVTRWLKHEGEHVSADEPLLEVSTDKVDTEIPSPVSGVLRGITVAEDETVAVGAELAVIDEDGTAGTAAESARAGALGPAADAGPAAGAEAAGHEQPAYQPPGYQAPGGQAQPYVQQETSGPQPPAGQAGYQPTPGYQPPPAYPQPGQP